jgi:hypothetical protein
VDEVLRRTAAIELDWRDVLPDDPVGPGDEWSADCAALSRRLAAYLNSGHAGHMRVRYEQDVVHLDAACAKLYVGDGGTSATTLIAPIARAPH